MTDDCQIYAFRPKSNPGKRAPSITDAAEAFSRDIDVICELFQATTPEAAPVAVVDKNGARALVATALKPLLREAPSSITAQDADGYVTAILEHFSTCDDPAARQTLSALQHALQLPHLKTFPELRGAMLALAVVNLSTTAFRDELSQTITQVIGD
jgi:hypothetical protein